MRLVTWEDVAARFRGRSVALVGSGPSLLENDGAFIDSHEVVVRVNNYRVYGIEDRSGYRTDVFYSFFGTSIHKTAAELERDGVRLCICKCPDSRPIESPWHEERGKRVGVDFRYIYLLRQAWWFCDLYIPDDVRFKGKFDLLDRHIPTTGFAAVLDILECAPRTLFLTGFDFFSSGVHNVDQRWKPGDPQDPIGHRPDLEARWLAENAARYPLVFDKTLERMLGTHKTVTA